MQRSPVFVFDNAREARNFSHWVTQHFAEIKEVTDKTTSIGRLRNIEHYTAGKLLFLRFNFTTGDAAGQNMVGKATFAACEWLRANHLAIRHHTLSGNMDTDKKSSFLNSLHARGKRVIAEAAIPGDLITNIAKFPPGELLRLRNITNTGAMLAGSSNNGMHSAKRDHSHLYRHGSGCGQCGRVFAGDCFCRSTTRQQLLLFDYHPIPDCRNLWRGHGAGHTTRMSGNHGFAMALARCAKLAEIVAATVLCGELSLLSAILARDWVSSHEKMGRNR